MLPLIKPPGGAQKRKTAVFGVKSHFALPLYEYCQQQSLKAFIDLTIRTKMIGEGRVTFYAKIWWMMTHPFANRRFSIYFRP